MRKRCIFTDGLKNKFAFQDFEEGIYCIIGPFEGFTADQEFQDELEDLCRRYNLKHGHLSQERYDAIVAERRAHKVMTSEEYTATPIVGWHEVCRDVDGFGGVGVRFLGISR